MITEVEEDAMLGNLALLPEQLARKQETWLHHLAASIISQAWNDLHLVGITSHPKSRRLTISQEARVWIEDHDRRHCLSFESCCLILDLDVDWLRKKLLEKGATPLATLKTP